MEKIIAERFPTREKASLEIYGKSGSVLANLVNLSASGACVSWLDSDWNVQKGDVIRMTVFLKALNRKHFVSAEVMWRQGQKSGLNFLKPDQVLSKIAEKTE